MKFIHLHGKLASSLKLLAIVDDDDFDRLNLIRWHAWKSKMKNGSTSTFYVVGSKNESMHRLVLNVTDGKIKVDHRNRNGLDNQKHNLRIGSHSHNLANRPKSVINSSGLKGAYIRPFARKQKFFSVISRDDKNRYLGSFDTLEQAARAYDKAAREQWGEFAYTNFPESA